LKDTILYLGEMEFPDKNAAALRVLSNVKIFYELNYKIVLLGLNKNSEKNFLSNLKKANDTDLYEYSYPKTVFEWFNFIYRIDFIKEVINKIGKNRIFAVITYNYPALAMKRLMKYCKKNKIYFISDTTEWYSKSKRKFPANLIKNYDTKKRMKTENPKAKNIICISNYLENYYKKKGCNTLNLPSIIDKNDEKWINNHYEPNKRKIFVYVGNPGKYFEKDRLDYLIEIFHRLNDEKYDFLFYIIGITKEEYIKYKNDHIKFINRLDHQIKFFGKKKNCEAINYIKKADFSIFFRINNRVNNAGFPTKVAESLGCGTPVITTPTSNISDYIKNGLNGFISKKCSKESIYEEVKKALFLSESDLIRMHRYSFEENLLDFRNFRKKTEIFLKNLM